jgi:hypothetical protein
MALDGQLSDFSLAEIFQLIASQQKSGFLTLETQPPMVFIFDKGVLISTRDRRCDQPDHLERFLRSYGFFDEAQWKHIDYVRSNSSLDLTEILASEQFLEEKKLVGILRSVAQEMTYLGMKLKRGRYHFTASRATPEGVRGRIALDVQGLLMEGARRLDEETILNEMFPSPVITFRRGSSLPPADKLGEGDAVILKLALAGLPLGRIIRMAQMDSFTTRDKLRRFCEDGYLEILQPRQATDEEEGEGAESGPRDRTLGLRSLPLTVGAVLLLLGLGWFRWQPLLTPGQAVPVANAASAGVHSFAPGLALRLPAQVRSMRQRQIQDEVVEAVELFRYRHGRYPVDLSLLVKEGMLEQDTYALVIAQRWIYRLRDNGQGFSLHS